MKKARKYDQLLQPGVKLGEWEVLHAPSRDKKGRAFVRCRCSCGTEHDVYAYPLVRGHTKQCKNCASGKTSTVVGLMNRTLRSAGGLKAASNYALSPDIISQSLSLQSYSCAVSSEPLSLTSAAVVRMDNNKGFTPDNSIIVSQTMKDSLNGMDLNSVYNVANFISPTPLPRPQITIQDFLNKRETQ